MEKRQKEFATGRILARNCLNELGIENTPILQGDRREPLWPRGVVGSISHSSCYCVVAVAFEARLRGLGIDVEDPEPLDESLWPVTLKAGEFDKLMALPRGRRGPLAKAVFSAKESVFKAAYPIYKIFLEFTDIEIRWNLESDDFAASISHSGINSIELQGRFLIRPSLICTSAILRRGTGEHV